MNGKNRHFKSVSPQLQLTGKLGGSVIDGLHTHERQPRWLGCRVGPQLNLLQACARECTVLSMRTSCSGT